MKYRMNDGTIVDTDNATESWTETTEWNGNNHVSRVTGSQWNHQQLYVSRKGRYYVEHWSQWQGSTSHVEWVSPEEATRWLLLCDYELPHNLVQYEETVSE